MMNQILVQYYNNNARKLRKLVDGILARFSGWSNKDVDDFYSLANEVFVDVMRKYDNSQSFEVFLYSCLSNRIKTEITKKNREKRKADKLSISIDTPIGDEEDITIADVIADDFDMEREVIGKEQETGSLRIAKYMDKLSRLQKSVLKLVVEGYLPEEIREKLQINKAQYADCYEAIHSYRNVCVLF
mgnify:FL=1